MNANAQTAMSKQLSYRAPFVASLKVEEYSESIRNRVLYALSSHFVRDDVQLKDKVTGDEINRWEVAMLFDWKIEGARLHKRIKSALYKKCGHQLPDELLRSIADIAATERNSDDLWIDVTPDFSWDSGDFGDDGSCYWGSYSSARTQYLPQLGASAVRSYETMDNGECGYGNGRGWIYPLPLFQTDNADVAVYVAFNPYGKFGDNHCTFAQICAMVAGDQNEKPYKWTRLYDHNLDGCYVNGADFLIYPSDLDLSTLISEDCFSDLLKRDEVRYSVNVSYTAIERVNCPLPSWAKNSDSHSGRVRCCDCGDRCDEESGYYEDGDFYCEDCYCERFSSCEFCDYTCQSEDMHEVDGHYICEDCRDRYCTQCDSCGDYHVTSTPRYHSHIETTGYMEVVSDGSTETWCTSCYEDNGFYCDVCCTEHDSRYMESEQIGHDCHCADCARERHAQDAADEETAMIEASPNVLTGHVLITDAKPTRIDYDGDRYYVGIYGNATYARTIVTMSMFDMTNAGFSPRWFLLECAQNCPF
jgi:hypothetical protein